MPYIKLFSILPTVTLSKNVRYRKFNPFSKPTVHQSPFSLQFPYGSRVTLCVGNLHIGIFLIWNVGPIYGLYALNRTIRQTMVQHVHNNDQRVSFSVYDHWVALFWPFNSIWGIFKLGQIAFGSRRVSGKCFSAGRVVDDHGSMVIQWRFAFFALHNTKL